MPPVDIIVIALLIAGYALVIGAVNGSRHGRLKAEAARLQRMLDNIKREREEVAREAAYQTQIDNLRRRLGIIPSE